MYCNFVCPSCNESVVISTEDAYDGFCTNCKICKTGIVMRMIKVKGAKHYLFRSIPHEQYVAPNQDVINGIKHKAS